MRFGRGATLAHICGMDQQIETEKARRQQEKELKKKRRSFDAIMANFPWLWLINSYWSHDPTSDPWLPITIDSDIQSFHDFVMSMNGFVHLSALEHKGEPLGKEFWVYQRTMKGSSCTAMWLAPPEIMVAQALHRNLCVDLTDLKIAWLRENKWGIYVFDLHPRNLDLAKKMIEQLATKDPYD